MELNMRRSSKKLMAFTLFLTMLLVVPSVAAGPSHVIMENNYVKVVFKLGDAGYDDLDGDGYEDDLYTEFVIGMKADDDYEFKKKVEIYGYLTMELPSGYTFNYERTWVFNHLDDGKWYVRYFNLKWINHAIEPGWYTFTLGLEVFHGGYMYDEASIIFDPPGGTPGGGFTLV